MIKELLIRNKISIVDKWIQFIIETYPLATSNFLKSQKDQFSNPVGHIISDSAGKIFTEIVNGRNIDKIKLLLKDIIKIRAVQDFLPSDAVGFIFSLKKVIRDEIEQEIKEEKNLNELVIIESFIDKIALVAFNLYMDAREKVFQIRVNEIKLKLPFYSEKGTKDFETEIKMNT